MNLRRFYSALLLLVPVISHAGLLEQGFQVDYTLSKNDFTVGVAEYRLYPQPAGGLIYESTARTEGLAALFIHDRIVERSHILQSQNGLRPQKYEYQQKGGKEDSGYQLKFDWQHHKLVNTHLKKTLDLPTDTQDMLSFQLELMKALQAGRKNFSFHLAEKNEINAYDLAFKKKMTLRTTLGEMEVVLMEHQQPKGHDVFRFWCAPGLQYLPVRIEHIEADGDRVVFQIRHFASLPHATVAQD